MPAMTKHPIALNADARKIDAKNGGSITKKRIAPEISATMLAAIANPRLTLRSCAIAIHRQAPQTTLLTPSLSRV